MPPYCLAAAFLLLAPFARAQHCAPIYESYLSEVSVKKVGDNLPSEHLKVHVQFAKEGGAGPKDSYQGYLLAYLDRDKAAVPASAPGDVIDPKKVLVLHTKVMRRNGKVDTPGPWTYDLEFTIPCVDLVDKVIAHFGLGEKDRENWPSWHCYRDRIRLAVFVPFLEDAKYSVLPGLPEEKHECNYTGDRALIFQELPHRLQFLVSHEKDTNGRIWLRILGDKPPRAAVDGK